MARFGFPLLTAGDIQTQLKNSLSLNFVTEEDITKPKSDTVKLIYTRLLALIDDRIDQDSFKPSEQESERLKFPDCHDISIPTIRLFKELSSLFSRIGCKEDPFRLSDLVSPDFKRTRYYLSALINFLRFVTEELNVKMDKNEDYVKGKMLNEELRKLKEEKDKLSFEVQSLNKFFNDNQALVSSKSEQIAELEAEKLRVLEERQKIEERIHLLKIEIDGTETSLNTLSGCLEEAVVMQKTLNDRIVEHPEQYLNLLKEKKDKYQDLHRLKENEKTLTEETKNKLAKMEGIVSKVREVAVLLETIELSNTKYKELYRALESHKQEKLKLEKNCFQKNLEIESLENDILRENSKREADRKNSESRSNSLISSIEAKRAELEYVNKQKQEILMEFNEKKRVLEEITDQQKAVNEKHEQVMQQLKDEHEKTVNKAELYSRKIIELLYSAEYLKPYLSGNLMGK